MKKQPTEDRMMYTRLQRKLRVVKKDLQAFASITQDWTARIILLQEFEYFRDRLKLFAKYHHGIGARRIRKRKKAKACRPQESEV